MGGQWFIAAEVNDPDEYVRLYELAEHVYTGYTDYRVQTQTAGRRIPMFRLSAIWTSREQAQNRTCEAR